MASQTSSARRPIEPPWHAYVTIDLLYSIARRSFLHWFVSWMIPMSLLAAGRSVPSPSVVGTSIYAAIVTLFSLASAIDDRIAFGPPRPVDLGEEVVVITGGANGLGLVMAQMLGMQGATVAVLDVEAPAVREVCGVTFYQCDVACRDQLQEAAKSIERDLGTPTILVNNAGVVNAKSVVDITPEEIDHTYRVNTFSHFHGIQVFLPFMLQQGRGTIVTVSSVMGHLGCARLPYTSTKAALLSLHASLRADLADLACSNPAARNIKTILVTPGQLNTRMFANVKTPSSFFAPVVEPVEIGREIVKLVVQGRGGEVSMPLYTRLIGFLDIVPPGVREMLRRIAGVDRAMIDAADKETSRPDSKKSR